MDLEQAAKTIEWLDDQRLKDRQVLTRLEEQIGAFPESVDALDRRVGKLETELSELRAVLVSRLDKLEELFEQQRDEQARFMEAEARRAEAAREAERALRVEYDGLSRAIADVGKPTEIIPRLMEEMEARKEEEHRLTRALASVQKAVEAAVEGRDERERMVTKVQESYRKDSKRISDVQTEVTDLRRRTDEHKGKLEVIEDIARRTETRVSDLATKENERRLAQSTWMEQQALTQAERDREWKDFRERADAFREQVDDWAERMKTYRETHREMQKALDTFYENLERLDRRISEAMEVQRLSEERFRQEWNAFLADDQKKWTTHMLLRDEQWREHDRQSAKALERLSAAEADIDDIEDALRDKAYAEQARLQALFNILREALAEYDQSLTKVR